MQNDFELTSKSGIRFGYFQFLEKAGFINAFSCRMNGESDVIPGTLNLALHVGDDCQKVIRNRKRFAEAIGVDANCFTTCAQVHGSRVQVVGKGQIGCGALAFDNTIKETDSLITNLPDVPLLLFYADCTPVLLADPVTGAIGLAHAGWRGTAAQIVKKTISAMADSYGVKPENILGAIGPSIGACCYEVDDVVKVKMPEYNQFFSDKGNGKYWLDLWQVNRQQLIEAGVAEEHIFVSGICTNDNPDLFFSYRYENGKTGRMGVCLCRKSNFA